MTVNIDTKPAHDINEADLQTLVTVRIAERRTIDYKAELPGNTSAAKREFLYDVTSFANSAGGLILFGIPERGDGSGEPESVAGLDCQSDAEINRLELMLFSGVDPRIPGIEIAPISLTNGRTVIALRIRRSWSRPHMVTTEGAQRFYARRNTGKYRMDVRDLRAAFVGAEEQAARIRDFRLTRLASIAAGDTPTLCRAQASRVVLHLVPLTLGEVGSEIDLHQIVGPGADTSRFPVMGTGSHSYPQWNFDGLVSSDIPEAGQPCEGYTQVFRSGAIEAVSEHAFGDHIFRGREYAYVLCKKIEKDAVESVRTYLQLLQRAGAQPPFYAMVSVLSVKGRVNAEFLQPGRFFGSDGTPEVANDDLLLPEVLIEAFDVAPEQILRHALDVLWQATGFAHSLCWIDDEWKPEG